MNGDEKRLSAISLRAKRYIVDARYTNHADWWEYVSAQDVQFLLTFIDQQQAEIASLRECIDRAEVTALANSGKP